MILTEIAPSLIKISKLDYLFNKHVYVVSSLKSVLVKAIHVTRP